ncbi:stress-responsive transcriptional regulator PspC [Pseudoramibacter sp.]|jgi:hypothetical protein|uniref:stress-responsive transcriptional regulator PspC n=1 Tax=Pseudoramibacter sp. TaxID=2034862 RepID=UPI0025E06ED6|nr:stress-responsive transcriptional regulator PspC [Pseudoramibacter sp.]MCH4073181.1 stress-responsive transcriptional regulator PspC [Pseudoramibacter sp.]MCH4106953.1 stress-responsive transcriptional regulator PspC [Pseudoramibacter sp.]
MKKFFAAFGAVIAGLTIGIGMVYGLEKRREKKVGGKLMRVNYRFSKDFDD